MSSNRHVRAKPRHSTLVAFDPLILPKLPPSVTIRRASRVPAAQVPPIAENQELDDSNMELTLSSDLDITVTPDINATLNDSQKLITFTPLTMDTPTSCRSSMSFEPSPDNTVYHSILDETIHYDDGLSQDGHDQFGSEVSQQRLYFQGVIIGKDKTIGELRRRVEELELTVEGQGRLLDKFQAVAEEIKTARGDLSTNG